MEKRRVRLEINGVVCGLITQESEEYMQSLAKDVREMIGEIQLASPYITREAAALTAALSYCDDAKKNGQKRKELQDRVDELEVEAEIWQEEKADMVKNGPNQETRARMQELELQNNALQDARQQAQSLRERVAALEKENADLRQETKHATQLEILRQELEELRKENGRLRKDPEPTPENQKLLRELEKLAADNAALKQAVEEQTSLAKKAEQEKQATVAAAKRAVEEAKKVVDQVKAESASAGSEVPDEASPEGEAQAGGHKRKNPLRHEEDYEQEGFVSFFEKK